MDETLNRIKKVLMTPENALRAVQTEKWDVTDVTKNYVAVVAAIPAVAVLVGLLGHGGFFRVLIYAASIYAMGFVVIFVFAKIIDLLAPYFNSTTSERGAFKLSVYAMTPALVAGILRVNPSLSSIRTLLSLYGIYILYLGLPVLMETPENKRVLYVVACAIAAMVVFAIMEAIVGRLAWGGGYNSWQVY